MVKRLKLNEKTVREAANIGRDYQIFDTDVRGFSVTIYPSGNRAFTLDYRVAGRQRRMTIGRWPEWTATAARERAKQLRREIDEGGDPLSQRQAAREAPRISDLIERYLAEHTPNLAPRSAADHHTIMHKLVGPDSRPSCESFGDWATRLRRVYSRRQRSARRTSGSASSSWPTPMSLHPGTGRYNPAGNSDFTRKAEALALGIAKALPNQWPTPAAQNWKGSSEASITRTDGKSRMGLLHYRAEQGFTRPAPATLPGGPRPSPHAPISRPLWASMIASHGRAVSRRILKGRSRRRLNPLFVGWLMGWPIGHALCACSATEFTLWQQHMRGALSQLPMASGPWIWRPTDAAQRPAQMDFLEGLQP